MPLRRDRQAGISATPKLIAHIGTPKTATTHLQTQLYKNREILQENSISYCAVGMGNLHNHRPLLDYLRCSAPLTEGLGKAFANQGASAEDLLISHENFCHLKGRSLSRFARLTNKYDVTLLLVVRNWPSYLYSNWQEEVKKGGSLSLSERLGVQFERAYKAIHLNPEILVERFVRQFDSNAVQVVVIDNIVSAGSDPFNYFWSEVLGLSGVDPVATKQQRRNTAMPPEKIASLQYLNKKLGIDMSDRGRSLRSAFFSAWKDAPELAAEIGRIFQRVSEEYTISTQHPVLRDLNRRLGGTLAPYLMNSSGPTLFPEGEKTYRHAVFENALDVEGLGAALDRLERRMLALPPT